MLDEMIELIQNWGGTELVAGLVLFILGVLSQSLVPWLLRLLGRSRDWVWAMVSQRGADRAFEKRYLDWLIDQHRHLGLLPAQVVARRWGERPKLAELEQIYVRLSMSSQAGDLRWAETYGEGESSWRKPPWRALQLFGYRQASYKQRAAVRSYAGIAATADVWLLAKLL